MKRLVPAGLLAVLALVGPTRGGPASAQPARPAARPEPARETDPKLRRYFEEAANERVRLGKIAYAKGDYEGALRLFLAADRLVHKPYLDYNISLCYEKMEKYVEAVLALRRYLQSGPPAASAGQAKTRLAYLLSVVWVPIRFTSYPAGAAIYIDGKEQGLRGRTPHEVKLRPGRYRVLMEATGHLPQAREVAVDVGGTDFFDFQLKRQSSLKVAASVTGARVAIDTDDMRRSELAPLEMIIAPGRHRVVVHREGYYRVERMVEVQPGEQNTLFVELSPMPRYGTLRVRCDATNATVQVETEEVGQTPLAAHRLLVGTYRVFVKKRGYRTWEKRVTIAAEQVTTITVQLHRKVSRRQMAWLIAGASVTGLLVATGAIMTLTALNTQREYEDLPRADLRLQGKRYALAADGLFAAGLLAGALTGFLTWRLRPSPSTGEVIVAPAAGPGFTGITARGRF